MEKCPICIDGTLIKKASGLGEEIYCGDCRGIVASAWFSFNFKVAGEEGIQECRGPENDPRPGFKGPGEKARCYLYDDGNEESKKRAEKKARGSAYSTQHRKAASKMINAVSYFNGANASVLPQTSMPSSSSTGGAPAPGASQTFSAQQMNNPNTSPSTSSQDFSGKTVPAAPGGVQPGELNGANPLNSGTTASTRLAELIQDDMGPGFCTKHMSYDGCNPSDEVN